MHCYLLTNLRASLQTSENLERQELIMELSPLVVQWREEALREGMQSGMRAERRATIENLLRVRFGSLDDQLRGYYRASLGLPPEEFTLLLQLSREELLVQFGKPTV